MSLIIIPVSLSLAQIKSDVGLVTLTQPSAAVLV